MKVNLTDKEKQGLFNLGKSKDHSCGCGRRDCSKVLKEIIRRKK